MGCGSIPGNPETPGYGHGHKMPQKKEEIREGLGEEVLLMLANTMSKGKTTSNRPEQT